MSAICSTDILMATLYGSLDGNKTIICTHIDGLLYNSLTAVY